jgi:hypothetical protein
MVCCQPCCPRVPRPHCLLTLPTILSTSCTRMAACAGCSMSLRAAQAKALQQQLQALRLRWLIGSQQQTLAASKGFVSTLPGSVGACSSSPSSQQAHLTTGNPTQGCNQFHLHSNCRHSSMGTTAHQNQQPGAKFLQGSMKRGAAAGPATPSPSSSISESFQLDRCAWGAHRKCQQLTACHACLCCSSMVYGWKHGCLIVTHVGVRAAI